MTSPVLAESATSTFQSGTTARCFDILMVSYNTPPYVFAGAGNQAVLLGNELIQQGHAVTLITSGAETAWITETTLGQLPTIVLRRFENKLLRLATFWLLSIVWWLANHHRFRAVHLHGCTHFTTLIWIALAKLFGKPVLMKVTCYGVDDLESLARYPVIGGIGAALLKQANGFIALTPQIAESLDTAGVGERSIQLPNAVDTNLFQPVQNSAQKNALRTRLGLPLDIPILIYTGGITPRKNIHFLIGVLSVLRQRIPNAMLCLVGPCKDQFYGYRQQLQQQIDTLSISQAVVFAGEVAYTDLPAWLQAADVYVFASRQEGLPSAPIEAMACGLPTVILELPGVTNRLYEGVSPNVVKRIPREEVGPFSAAVEAFLSGSERSNISKTARTFAQQHFGVETLARQYTERVYGSLL